jgi:hypothetical protein
VTEFAFRIDLSRPDRSATPTDEVARNAQPSNFATRSKISHTKLANDLFPGLFWIVPAKFFFNITGVNLNLTIRGSRTSAVEPPLRVIVRHQNRYSRSTQSTNTRRSGAAGPKERLVCMLIHH